MRPALFFVGGICCDSQLLVLRFCLIFFSFSISFILYLQLFTIYSLYHDHFSGDESTLESMATSVD